MTRPEAEQLVSEISRHHFREWQRAGSMSRAPGDYYVYATNTRSRQQVRFESAEVFRLVAKAERRAEV